MMETMKAHQPGMFWAFVNAGLQERDSRVCSAVALFGSVCSRVQGLEGTERVAGRDISYFNGVHAQSLHAASISRAALSSFRGLLARRQALAPSRNGFFAGFFNCPNQAFYATMSAGSLAGAAARGLVVSINDKLTLHGIKLDKAEPTVLEEKAIRSFFNELDENKDGVIGYDELLHLLHRMGLPTEATYLQDLVQQYNTTVASCRVTYDSFQRYIVKQNVKLRQAFSDLDADGTGVITECSLLRALQSMGLPADGSDARRMIDLLDSSKGNCVTYLDFCRYACLLPAAQVNNGNVTFCWVDSADYLNGVEYRLCMTPPKQTFQRLLAGGIAGAISRTMVAPLERLRTIMMASCPPMSMQQSIAAMWCDGGWRGLFKGNMATVVKVLPASAVQFAVYDGTKDVLSALVPRAEGVALASWERLLAGCIAGVSSSVITYPLETIRTLMSMPSGLNGGFLQAAVHSLRERGLLGLYRGYSSAIVNEALGTGLGFLAYETGNQLWERVHGSKPDARQKGLVGALSAVLVMTATMPFELIMRRMQVAGTAMGAKFQYTGTLDAMRKIMATEGVGAFYRGSLFSYAKVVPSIGAMYMFYELLNRAMAIGGLRSYAQDRTPVRDRRQACTGRQKAEQASTTLLASQSRRLTATI